MGPSSSLPVQHIALDERGRAFIDGTRITVAELMARAKANGWSAEELAEQYPHISPAQIHAAFSYYYDHKMAIDQENERLDREFEERRRNAPETPLARRVKELRAKPHAEENLGR